VLFAYFEYVSETLEIGTERSRTAERYLEDMKEGVQVSIHYTPVLWI
jgi:hypothetical protein